MNYGLQHFGIGTKCKHMTKSVVVKDIIWMRRFPRPISVSEGSQ